MKLIKILSLLFFSLGFTLSLSAQGVISFSSGTFENSDIQFTFIAGQAISGTFSSENFSLVSGSGSISRPVPVSVDHSEQNMPVAYRLSQNYPNPFNPTTTIPYTLPQSADVRIEVFNVIGIRVASIDEGQKPAGFYTAMFNASTLSSGLYLYRLTANGRTIDTKKMMLVK